MKKKRTGDIILYKCTINCNHMVYGSWDMKHDGQKFLSFRTVFCPFTPLTNLEIKILKNWNKDLEISSFYTGVVGVKKEQNIVQNNKKFCPLGLLYQEPYIMWLSFILHMCVMIISPDNFSISKFWFFRLLGWKGKKLSKMAKASVFHTLYFRNHISYDLHLWYTCMYKKIISPDLFCIFFKILIFRIIRGVVKGKKWPKMTKIFVVRSVTTFGHTKISAQILID